MIELSDVIDAGLRLNAWALGVAWVELQIVVPLSLAYLLVRWARRGLGRS